jgi:hypothetical protein
MDATTVAVDLAKDVFEVALANRAGRVLERKRLNRRQFERFRRLCGERSWWECPPPPAHAAGIPVQHPATRFARHAAGGGDQARGDLERTSAHQSTGRAQRQLTASAYAVDFAAAFRRFQASRSLRFVAADIL